MGGGGGRQKGAPVPTPSVTGCGKAQGGAGRRGKAGVMGLGVRLRDYDVQGAA